ncbi:hypothetical protein Tco_0632613 [Tanacetum coccineum]
MYPRFLQLFLNNQIENLTPTFNDEYDTPSHTKKVFANMRRQGKDFSGTVTPLFATMLIQPQADVGEDETVHKERGDNMERVATTAASLDAEQDNGNIIRTQSMATLNEPIPQGTGLGVNTTGSGEDRLKIMELMEICTKLSDRVLALENVKIAQDLEITSLKKRVKKLEKKKKERTPQLKRRLFKIRIESSADKSLEDVETQGRYDQDIDVTTVSAPITTAGVSVSTAEPSTPLITTTVIEDEDLIIAQTLMKMRKPSEFGTRKVVPPSQHDLKDKGKAKIIEPEKPLKKKDQIKFDEDVAKRLVEELEAELEEEERVAKQREEEANLIS